MKGNKEILGLLNDVLAGELVAISQYFLHAKMCENWGYRTIAAKVRLESIDEMKHADQLVGRILFLEGTPNLQKLGALHIGESVREQFQSDRALEQDAIARLNAGLESCRKLGDGGSEAMLQAILTAEEAHIDWIETQLGLIEKLGEANYLAQQLGA